MPVDVDVEDEAAGITREVVDGICRLKGFVSLIDELSAAAAADDVVC